MTPTDRAGPSGPNDLGFERFFRDNYTTLARYLMSTGGSRAEVEDAIQDAFMAVYNRWDTVKDFESPRAYLYKAAVHQTLRLRRVSQRQQSVRDDPLLDGQAAERGPEEAVTTRETIFAAIEAMSPRMRQVMTLTAAEFSTSEVAEILGITPGSVRTYKVRARKELLNWISPHLLTDEGETALAPARESGSGKTEPKTPHSDA